MIKRLYLRVVKLSALIVAANVLFLIYSGFTGAAVPGWAGLACAVLFLFSLLVLFSAFLFEPWSKEPRNFDRRAFKQTNYLEEQDRRALLAQIARDEAARAAIAEQQRTMTAWWVNHNRY